MTITHLRRVLAVGIWTAFLVVFLYFLYRQYNEGSRLLAIGPVLMSIGMVCDGLRTFVTRASLRLRLRLTALALIFSSLTASLFL